MDETLMSKATFSEICRIMKHKDGAVRECIQSVVKLSLLLLPGLMCKDLAAAIALEAGLVNVDVKNVVDETINSVKSAFKKETDDFTSRAQDAQIAHVLIVFAAYFDSIKLYLPDSNRAIELSNKEKIILTEHSLDDYNEFLKDQSTQEISDECIEVIDYPLSMPNPVEGLESSMERLGKFYELLNSRFLDFVEQLSYVESMRGHKKDRFYATMRSIPKKALESYRNQYYELSALFPDFFVWATQREHEEILHSIDIGFDDISKKLNNIAEVASASTAYRALNALHRNYISYTNKPVVSNEEMPLGEHEVRLPTRDTCFIPQAFRTLIYQDKLTLEHTDRWIVRQRIGEFLANTLRSPELGVKPVIILGDPGSGKTMLCHMLAAKILHNEYHVIVLHLRNLAADGEIYQQINQELEKSLQGMPCVWGDIVSSKLRKPILLIFDGYDELLQASGKTHSNYLEKISQFQEQAASLYDVTVRTIVTSRKVLIDKAQIPIGSAVVLLDEFDDARIELWCDIWNKHNLEYFSGKNLEPFSVTSTSKARDLAKQPLLLLMLALFDSNSNALRQHQNLSATQLYNSLIRDFIEREQKKDPVFDQKTSDIRQMIVDQEMERVCIAALGMYNRNNLHISSCQLQEDLRLLSSVREDTDLQDSDKLFGSFFFIHRSDSVKNEERVRVVSSAYEFLHNTFGEFLTAHYLVMQTCNLLEDFLNCQQRQRIPTMAEQYKWYACMSFAPMFHRPVVAEMIASWAPLYFHDKGLTAEDISAATDLLIEYEMPRILRGDVLAELNATQARFRSRDSYPELDSLTHLAVYSNNFVSLMSLICDGLSLELLERQDLQAWPKLRHLWHYTFSEDDLAEFAACFSVNHHEKAHVLENRFSEGHKRRLLLATRNRSKKLFETQVALNEELDYTALGMLFGYDYKTVQDGLHHQNIPQKAWLAIRHLVNQQDIFTPAVQPYVLNMLDDVFLHGLKERDGSALFYGFSLLKFLTNPDNTFLSGCFQAQQYTTPGWLCFAYHQFSGMIENKEYHTDKPLGLIILEIFNQIPLDTDGCETICRDLFPYKFRRNQYSEVELLHLARLGQRIITIYLDNQEPIPCHMLDSYIVSLADTFDVVCRSQSRPIAEHIIQEVLTTTVKLMAYYGDENIYHLLMIYRDNVQQWIDQEAFEFTAGHASILIHALQLYHKDENDGSRLAVELMPYIMNSGSQAINVFDCDPSAVPDLIRIAQLFPHDIGIPLLPMLIDLVNERAEKLTYGMYKQLLKMSHDFSCNELFDAIVQNLG